MFFFLAKTPDYKAQLAVGLAEIVLSAGLFAMSALVFMGLPALILTTLAMVLLIDGMFETIGGSVGLEVSNTPMPDAL